METDVPQPKMLIWSGKNGDLGPGTSPPVPGASQWRGSSLSQHTGAQNRCLGTRNIRAMALTLVLSPDWWGGREAPTGSRERSGIQQTTPPGFWHQMKGFLRLRQGINANQPQN